MIYDDAAVHYNGDFPATSPQLYGGTHIALFMRYCFAKKWAGPIHVQQRPAEVQGVIDGTLSATGFLFQYCNGRLSDADLNDAGNAFAGPYYGRDGMYIYDYLQNFGDLMYIAPESDHSFMKQGIFMEARLRNKILTRTQYAAQPK